ncbi:uncharacterized protein LOC131854586 [Achroia grisella]|uniref:uncharacterized protein LOC131854586 n=1 Tax=Achroia grisella TaxID=688607 RepID=UPI0027D2E12D|nr:uncharacterized protein LOC131854586 [Achroia grisella]
MSGTKNPCNNNKPSLPKPYIKTCCFCFPIRKGCFILGYLNLVNTLLSLVYITYYTIMVSEATHGFDHFDVPFGIDVKLNPEYSEERMQDQLTKAEIILAVGLSMCVVWAIVNIICLVGLHMNRVGLIRVYLVFAFIRMILIMLRITYLTSSELSIFVVEIFNFVLTAYFTLIYYSYVKQLEYKELLKIYIVDARNMQNTVPQYYPTIIEEKTVVEKF